jgi:hypothetical protein
MPTRDQVPGAPEPGDQAPLAGSPQQPVDPPAPNPTRNARVMDWVKQRAAAELRGGD